MFLLRNPRLLTAFAVVIVFFSINGIEEVASCSFNSECYINDVDEVCCRGEYSYYDYGNRICGSSCIGYACISNDDCASGECCDENDKCQKECYPGLAAGIVAVIVIGVILVIAVPVAIILCCCCCGVAAASGSRRPVHGGVVIAQPQANMTVVTSQNQTSQIQAPGYPPAVVQPQAYAYPPQQGYVPPQYPMQVAPPPYTQ